MTGRIIKGIGGFYYVSSNIDGVVYECKARGRFRKEKISPCVGDYVEFEVCDGGNVINKILPRKNILVRPVVSNIDAMVIVISAGKPTADLMLCDKLIIQAETNNIQPIICINKVETDKENAKNLLEEYAAYDCIGMSAVEKTGFGELNELIKDKCICFAGQSAVGKSSILNVLDETLNCEVGGLSKKTARGKHTTRTAELFYVDEPNAYVLDTPGFSMFEMSTIEKWQISHYYNEFKDYFSDCKFSPCLHENEPVCGVKEAVKKGNIKANRYNRYLKLLQEWEKQK